jgi:effector-binding domain-containing protein
MCLLPPTPDETVLLQMCTAIDDPPPGEHVMTVPAALLAVARHVGPYEEMGLAEHALYAWAEEHGFEPSGPIRELYLNDPQHVVPEALETEVMLPVTRPSGRTPETAAARR